MWRIVIILLLLIVLATNVSYSKEQPQLKTTESKETTETEQRGSDKNPIAIKVIPAPDAEAKAAQEEQYRLEKATEDKWLTDATIWLAAITTPLAIFTGLLWWATYKLVREAKDAATRQAEEMKETLRIAQESAAASKKMALTMEDTAKKELRAYLSIVTGSCIPQDRNTGWRYEIRPFIKNTGKTPAHAVTVASRAAIFPFPLPDDVDLSLPSAGWEAAGHIAPDQSFFYAAILAELISDEEIAEITTGISRKLYMYGTVRYKDIFGESHYTNFCHFSVWDKTGNFGEINITRHNDAT